MHDTSTLNSGSDYALLFLMLLSIQIMSFKFPVTKFYLRICTFIFVCVESSRDFTRKSEEANR